MPRKLVAGNWKMNGTRGDLAQLDVLNMRHANASVDIMICPPATLIAACDKNQIMIGGQDCHTNTSGAHTGDISAVMLADAGAVAVITGHSERRIDHGETSEFVAEKSNAAHAAQLTAIICIGETLAQRDAAETLNLIDTQLTQSVPDTANAQNTIIAYEPIWAIGTGKVPSLLQITEVHAHIRARLMSRFEDGGDFTILYGGSVKGSNAAEIFAVPNVDGALVGGASLKADDFSPIITALETA